MLTLIPGVTVTETGTGANRQVQVINLYSIGSGEHPRRFMRLSTVRKG